LQTFLNQIKIEGPRSKRGIGVAEELINPVCWCVDVFAIMRGFGRLNIGVNRGGIAVREGAKGIVKWDWVRCNCRHCSVPGASCAVALVDAADEGENCIVVAEKWLAELGFAGGGLINVEFGFAGRGGVGVANVVGGRLTKGKSGVIGRRRVGIVIVGLRDATARSKAWVAIVVWR
jgi:hypothetical protein